MDRFAGQQKFELQDIMEQRPFESPAVQSFFAKWCKINDSIVPEVVGRDEWEKRGLNGVLEKRPDGKQILLIPKDLQLWEMVGVIETIDRDTFANRPERQNVKKEEIVKLGNTFCATGIYLAQRIDALDEGKEIAKALAEEFFNYGKALSSGQKSAEEISFDDLAKESLSSNEIEDVDHFLAGDVLYASRRARVEKTLQTGPEKKDEVYETERQNTLRQFFRVAEKAFLLTEKTKNEELVDATEGMKPWQSHDSFHETFLRKVEKAMKEEIEAPNREIYSAIFRRGLIRLVDEMREVDGQGWVAKVGIFLASIGFDIKIEQRKLSDVLHIAQLKSDLEAIRETGNLAAMSEKELEIADKIQQAVSSFPYRKTSNNPSEMIATQYINCVGASMLGGALLSEVGVRYLVGDVPGHSVLGIITSDGTLVHRDMINPEQNINITDDVLKRGVAVHKIVTTKDIIEYANNPRPRGLKLKKDISVYPPEIGQQLQVLGNMGCALKNLKYYKESVEAFQQALTLAQDKGALYFSLADSLQELGRHEEAIHALQKAIKINPNKALLFWMLGRSFFKLGRHKDAVEAAHQAKVVSPEDFTS